MTHTKKLHIKRTFVQEYNVTWPDDYPGMTLKEAIEYERNMETDEAIEIIYHSESDYKLESEITELSDA